MSNWARITVYKDEDSREIHEFKIMAGPNKNKKFYHGKVYLQARFNIDQNNPQQKIVPFEFKFPEHKNLEWIQENFENEAQKAIKEFDERRIKMFQNQSSENSKEI
jgi:hypothetical protein